MWRKFVAGSSSSSSHPFSFLCFFFLHAPAHSAAAAVEVTQNTGPVFPSSPFSLVCPPLRRRKKKPTKRAEGGGKTVVVETCEVDEKRGERTGRRSTKTFRIGQSPSAMTRPVLLNKTRPKLSFSSFLSPRWWWYPFAPVFSSPPALKKESPPPSHFLCTKSSIRNRGRERGGG